MCTLLIIFTTYITQDISIMPLILSLSLFQDCLSTVTVIQRRKQVNHEYGNASRLISVLNWRRRVKPRKN